LLLFLHSSLLLDCPRLFHENLLHLSWFDCHSDVEWFYHSKRPKTL
jgi:hypothetical protein